MESNTHSVESPGLTALAMAVNGLAAQDLAGLADAARAERVLVLRRLLDRLEGHWLREVAAVDARGAAGAEQGLQAASTASWLRARLRMGATTASSLVRTARALFRGPLPATAEALADGEITAAHAAVLVHGTQDLAAHTTAEAEPVLLEAARRLDPPRLRRVIAHLRLVADPDTAASQAQRRHEQRGLWLSPTLDGMVALDGLLEPEACRRLACDGAATRVLVTRHPSDHHRHHDPDGHHDPSGLGSDEAGLAARLRTAAALLPPVLGGAPSQPLEVGRSSRVVQAAQRAALAVRDTGGVFPGCQRPWPGATPTTCATGSTAAPPTYPTWPWCAALITGRCMRGLATRPRPRRPPHRHPTPPTTAKTPGRRLTR